MLKIYGNPISRASRVIWMAEELGLEYEVVSLDIPAGEHRREPFLSMNPLGKVPVIKDGDFHLTESSAILTYLADKYFDLGLIPPARSQERALYNQWMAFAISELEPAAWAVLRQFLFLPAEKHSADINSAAKADFERAAGCLSNHLQKSPYLLGDKFQAVDILMSHVVSWGNYTKMPGVDSTLLKYLERTEDRPAYQTFKSKYLKNIR